MSTNKKQKKRVFSIDKTSDSIFIQFPPPKRNTVITLILILLLIIVIFVAANEPTLRIKSMELVISIIEVVVTFFNINPKTK